MPLCKHPLRDPGEQHSRYRLNEAFYDQVRGSERRLSEQIVVPPLSGRALVVERGQAFRIIEADGPQAGDVAFWNADDPDESLSCLRTWELEGWFLRPNTRLWSDVPWLRPMATCIEERWVAAKTAKPTITTSWRVSAAQSPWRCAPAGRA